jgi:hypothetical protein
MVDRVLRTALGFALAAVVGGACAQDPGTLPELPLWTSDRLAFAGAFRLPDGDFGASRAAYAEGPLFVDGARGTFYLVGHAHHQAIAEFALPPLVRSERQEDLAIAGPPLQPFATVLDRAVGGNPQALDTIGGLARVDTADGSQLVVNAWVYYDADAATTHTTFVMRDADDLAGGRIDGPFTLAGGAGHASGWLTSVPDVWRGALGGPWIAGFSSGPPLISRLTVGPSAFAFDPAALLASPGGQVPTVTLLDYDLEHPLHPDLDAVSGANDLWTHLSRAVVGFVVPGTRTYLTFGHTGGHRTGVCYKCVPVGATEACGGFCPNHADDVDTAYWAFDLLDLLAVREGRLAPHAVRPYAFGAIDLPFVGPDRELAGGTFDPVSGLAYLVVRFGDPLQNEWEPLPVVVAVSLDAE